MIINTCNTHTRFNSYNACEVSSSCCWFSWMVRSCAAASSRCSHACASSASAWKARRCHIHQISEGKISFIESNDATLAPASCRARTKSHQTWTSANRAAPGTIIRYYNSITVVMMTNLSKQIELPPTNCHFSTNYFFNNSINS